MADVAHRPLGDAEPLTKLGDLHRVEFVGGPRDGQGDDMDQMPEFIAIDGGRYRRSVRCAEDGAMRYVWIDGADGRKEGPRWPTGS